MGTEMNCLRHVCSIKLLLPKDWNMNINTPRSAARMRLIILVFLLFQTSLAQRCVEDQKLSLLQFKHDSLSDSSSSSSPLASWKAETDCCSWEGIACDNATGYVISLNLSQNQLLLRVESNSSLFQLNTLQKLDISGNFFGPSNLLSDDITPNAAISAPINETSDTQNSQEVVIPTGFSKLANLTYLSLANSGFSGQIPLAISHLTRLEFLDLSGNNLKLEHPNLKMLIQDMSSLRELHLGGVDMSRQNSNWCQALSSAVPNLRVLILWSCSLSGPIDSSLLKLHSLSEIDLWNNNISSEVPEFLASFPSLTSINLSYCNLHGKFPKNIFKLPNLKEIQVSFNPNLFGSLPEFPEKNAIQQLSLSATNFYGVLPESIGNLKYLTELSLADCNFSGRIPNSIANLTQLAYLDLSSNNFSGSFPSLAKKLPKLWYLNSHNNSLDGVIHYSLFTFPSLKYLLLGQNRFQDLPAEIPDVLSPLLSDLDLSNNELQGSVPRQFSKLWSLEGLNLAFNNLTGSLELDMFSNMTGLSYLDLSYNSLSITSSPNLILPNLWKLGMTSCSITEFPSFLRNIPKLNFLDLSNNKIQGQIPNWIWKDNLATLNLSLNSLSSLARPFPDPSTLQLIYLDLHDNKIEGPLPFLSQYTTFLDFSNNKFTSAIPADIFDYISNATFFSVSGNRLVGEIPESICSAERLQVLDLSNNNFTGTIPKCLGKFSQVLSVINLGGNSLQGTMPEAYSSSLRSLVVNGNQLEGMVPRSLSSCTSMEVLDLGNNRIYDTFPSWLESLPKLRVLVLRDNRLHGPIGHPQTANPFPVLHVLDLSSNGFTGHLPSDYFHNWKAMMSTEEGRTQAKYLGSRYYHDSVTVTMKGRDILLVRILTIFSSLDLSKNGFIGEIPELIGELKSLHVLNLSHNSLDGHIPSSLEMLRNLESLDLSDNKLSGEIPWQLTSLTFLSVLNLSRNELEGIIPRGRQFDTFTAASYEGNPNLCGLPLSRKCQESSGALPPDEQHSGSGSESEFDWKYVPIGYGCGFVAGVSIGYMLPWKIHRFFATFALSKHHQRTKNRRRTSRI